MHVIIAHAIEFSFFCSIVTLLLLMFLSYFPRSCLSGFMKYDKPEIICISKQRSYLFNIYESYISELRLGTNRGF